LSNDPEKLEKVLQKMTELLEKHKVLENRMKNIENTILKSDKNSETEQE
jgi:hypothetical protein